MGKAILIIDMPECCDECDIICDQYYSAIRNENFDNNMKPDICPLRDLQNKKSDGESLKVAIENDCYDGTTEDKAYFAGYDNGYNACIDELLKGEEG